MAENRLKSPIKYGLSALLLLLALAWQGGVVAAEASVDRERMSEGETLTLTIVLPADVADEPDLTPLQQDFDILNRSQSSHTSIINGKVDSKRIWRLMLAPKRSGRLTIPALSIGGTSTRSFTVEVLPAGSQAANGEAPPVFVETEVSEPSPYVQEQVIYSVRIFSRAALRQASLSEPGADGALVERLGEDRAYTSVRDGLRYQVIERRYALFPQSSGKLTIESPLLSASIPVEGRRSRRNDLFFGGFPDIDDMFAETRPVRLRGKQQELQVAPRATHGSGHWLPAQSLGLSESWSSPPERVQAGEPLTRTLTIRARGLTASQLPDLRMREIPGLKMYPDQPQVEQQADADSIETVKQIKTALVPTAAGRLELPEIRLDWWDTETDRRRSEVIPARVIQVVPAPASQQTAPPAPVIAAPATPREVAPADAAAAPPIPIVDPGYWPWISAGLGAGWVLTLLLWLYDRRRRPTRAAEPTHGARAPAPKTTVKDIRKAFRGGDPRAARAALLDWAAGRWPERPPKGLDGLARRLGDAQAATALSSLDTLLYAENQATWDGKAAFDRIAPVLAAVRRQNDRISETQALPELYPQ